MEETNKINVKQAEWYKETKGKAELMDGSLSDLVHYFISQDDKKCEEECRALNRSLNLNEQVYFAVVIKAYADAQNWPEVAKFNKMKSPPVPYAAIGELLYDAGNREMSSMTFRKVPNKELRIELLIDHGFWKPAIEEMLDTKLYEDYEE